MTTDILKKRNKEEIRDLVQVVLDGCLNQGPVDFGEIADVLEELRNEYLDYQELSDFCETQQDGDDIIGHRD